MENRKYYDQFQSPPQWALKEIKGGRMNGKTDINPQFRILALTEMFGPVGIGWYYKTVSRWMEPYQPTGEIATFVAIELFVKVNGEWSMPIEGTGGSMFVAREKNGPFVSDEVYKMATTDALSVACKQLGIAGSIYSGSKYDANQQPAQPKTPQQKQKPQLTPAQFAKAMESTSVSDLEKALKVFSMTSDQQANIILLIENLKQV